MDHSNLHRYLMIIENPETKNIVHEIGETNLVWLSENKYITYQKLQGDIMYGPFLLNEGKVFLENFDVSWKGHLERELRKYEYIHSTIYLPLLAFLIGILLTKLGLFGPSIFF